MPTKRAAKATLLVVLALAALGALAGIGWWLWWRPVPAGLVWAHHPFFLPDDEFRSTGEFVMIAGPLGLVVGVLGMWRLRLDPVLSLAALLTGACAATGAMLLVGHLLGPGSAVDFARRAGDGTLVHAGLRAQPLAAWVTMPLGVVLGALGMLLAVPTSEDHAEVPRLPDRVS